MPYQPARTTEKQQELHYYADEHPGQAGEGVKT